MLATAGSLIFVSLSLSGPATAATKVSISLTQTKVIKDESIDVSGTVATKFVRPVRLQYKSGSKWVTTAKSTTTGTGTYSVKTSTAKARKYRIYMPKIKILKKSWSSVTSSSKSVSIVAQSARITIDIFPAYPDDIVPVTGTFVPSRPGRNVSLQLQDNAGWTTVDSAPQNAQGKVVFSQIAPRVGNHPRNDWLRVTATTSNGAAAVESARNNLTTLPIPIPAPGVSTPLSPAKLIASDAHMSAISGDGRYIAFNSRSPALGITEDNDQLFLYDSETESSELISKNNSGEPSARTPTDIQFSANGRYLIYETEAWNLIPGRTDGSAKIIRYDTQTGATLLVSRTTFEGNPVGAAKEPSISGDGNLVVFTQSGGLFLADINAGTVERLTTESVSQPVINTQGTYVAFQAVLDKNPLDCECRRWDVYRLNIATRAVERVSSKPDGTAGADSSRAPSISGDGHLVSFTSESEDLGPYPSDRLLGVFVRDMDANTTRWVSDNDVLETYTTTSRNDIQQLSDDGRFLTYIGWLLDKPPTLIRVNLTTGKREHQPVAVSGYWAHAIRTPTLDNDGLSLAFIVDEKLYRIDTTG